MQLLILRRRNSTRREHDDTDAQCNTNRDPTQSQTAPLPRLRRRLAAQTVAGATHRHASGTCPPRPAPSTWRLYSQRPRLRPAPRTCPKTEEDDTTHTQGGAVFRHLRCAHQPAMPSKPGTATAAALSARIRTASQSRRYHTRHHASRRGDGRAGHMDITRAKQGRVAWLGSSAGAAPAAGTGGDVDLKQELALGTKCTNHSMHARTYSSTTLLYMRTVYEPG